jgi:hypothetical protein
MGVISAITNPTKKKNGEHDLLLEEIELTTQTTVAPQQRTCSYSKYSWTALYQQKKQNA